MKYNMDLFFSGYLTDQWVVVFQVNCHVEMSYFEVYNEKIHDLLVTRDEPNQRRMPVSGTFSDKPAILPVGEWKVLVVSFLILYQDSMELFLDALMLNALCIQLCMVIGKNE